MKKFDIKITLKLAKIAVEKYSENTSSPGFVITQDGQKLKVKFTELIKALEELAEEDLVAVRRCRDCENWSSAPRAKKGVCFPKNYSCDRNPDDFCSHDYVCRSKERREIDGAVNRLLPKE